MIKWLDLYNKIPTVHIGEWQWLFVFFVRFLVRYPKHGLWDADLHAGGSMKSMYGKHL